MEYNRIIVGETNLQCIQIDFFIMHECYECAYGSEDLRNDPTHK